MDRLPTEVIVLSEGIILSGGESRVTTRWIRGAIGLPLNEVRGHLILAATYFKTGRQQKRISPAVLIRYIRL
jgi:hypothetical protein